MISQNLAAFIIDRNDFVDTYFWGKQPPQFKGLNVAS